MLFAEKGMSSIDFLLSAFHEALSQEMSLTDGSAFVDLLVQNRWVVRSKLNKCQRYLAAQPPSSRFFH